MSKIDKIVATFTTTVNKLRKEAGRLHDVSLVSHELAAEATAAGDDAMNEHNRAVRIANNLEGIING